MQRRRIADLAPADYNPRRITDKAKAGLKRSLDEFGVVQPIVFNETTGRVVGGHQRLALLVEQGALETDVVVVRLPESREKALNVALNNPAIGGDFTENLQGLLEEIAQKEQDLFEGLCLDELLSPTDVTGLVEEEDDEAPPLPATATSKEGDIWVLGEHRLACGSSAERGIVEPALDGGKVRCVWTDPPYGVTYEGGGKPREMIQNDDLDEQSLEDLVIASLSLACEVTQPGGAAYVAHPATGMLPLLFMLSVTKSGWRIKQGLVWDKSQISVGRADYHWKHEPIIYAIKPQAKGRHGRFGGEGWYGDNTQCSVFAVERPRSADLHPTMKPVELVAQMVANSTKPGDLVYDPFGGSGSTLIACERLGRRNVSVELDPKYCDVIVERWQQATGGQAVRR